MKRLIVAALTSLLLAGCAHVFSERAESRVDPAITFEQVRKEPQAFVGKYIKVGGIIASTKNTRTGSQIEVVQLRLNDDAIPEEKGGTSGRFLATSSDYLDSLLYKSGRSVSLIGEVRGVETRTLGEIEYAYPVIAIMEIRLWKEEELTPYPGYYYEPYPYRGYGPPFWYPYGPRHYYW